MTLKYILFLSSFAVGLWACQTLVLSDFPVPYEGRKSVLVGWVGPDNGLMVYAASTVPILNGKKDSLKHPIFEFLESGISIEKPVYAGGKIWVSDTFRPKIGKSYQLSLKSDSIAPVLSSSEIMPAAIPIDTVRLLTRTDSTTRRIQIAFKDAIGKHYYGIKIVQYYKDTLLEPYYNSFLPVDPSNVFDDTDFEGRNTLREMMVNLNYTKKNNYANHFKIMLYSLSKSGYVFLNALAETRLIEGDYFTEPSKVASNIVGGYGCFGAYNYTTFDIKF